MCLDLRDAIGAVLRRRGIVALFCTVFVLVAVLLMSSSSLGNRCETSIETSDDLLDFVQKAHERSTERRMEILEADILQNTLWPYNVWGDTMWALSALYLNERVDEANDKIMSYSNSKEPFAYFGLPDYVRILCFFNSNSVHYPGRLRPEVEDAMKSVLWRTISDITYPPFEDQWSRGVSKIKNASPDAIWFLHSSENHDLIHKVNYYLTLSVLRHDPEYKDKKLDDGYSVEEHFQAWNSYFKEWLRERAARGLWVEIGSDTYQKYSYPNIINLHDLSPDPEVRQLAEMFLDICFIEEAQMSFSDGFRGGGKSRVGRSETRWQTPRGALGRSSFEPYKNVLYGDDGSSSHSRVFETSSYQVPKVAILLGKLDVDRDQEPIIIKNRVLGENAVGQKTDQSYALAADSALVNYCYKTPYYMLGSTLQDPRISYSAISMQDRWSGIVFNDEQRSRIIPHPEPSRSGAHPNTRTHDAYWNFQYENIMIVQKLYKAQYMKGMRIYFSTDLVKIEDAGWVFVDNGDAFAAIRPAYGGYQWDTSWMWSLPLPNGEYTKEMMLLNDEYAPVIFHAGDINEYSSFEEFKAVVLSSHLEVSGNKILYRVAGMPEIEFYSNFELPRVGGDRIELRTSYTYNSPYLQSEWDSYKVTVRYGGHTWVYDFQLSTISKVE